MEERNQQTKINHHSRCRPDLKVLSTGAVDKEDHDNINLRMQPPTLMEKMFTQQQMLGVGPMYNPSFNMPTIEDYSFKNITLTPSPIYSPSFEMPAIRDYSLDNIRLTPPQIYTPPMHIYEPQVYIPPVIINP